MRTAWISTLSFAVVSRLDADKFNTILDDSPEEKELILSRIAAKSGIKGFKKSLYSQEESQDGQQLRVGTQATSPAEAASELTPLMSDRGDENDHSREEAAADKAPGMRLPFTGAQAESFMRGHGAPAYRTQLSRLSRLWL